ncbi:MAG: aldehyde dehydrogenase [Candidatus Erginobacter occultus]|nr:aldehyde dehydrogenase [Candidatus Erginobacter occultus]
MNGDNIAGLVRGQREFFSGGGTRGLEARTEALDKLQRLLREGEAELLAALKADLGKPETEAYLSEIAFVEGEIALARKKLKSWSRPRRVRTGWLTFPASGRIYPSPYGTALIIGPWNYPLQLLLAPLVGALAAGNTAVLKPSELAPATSRTLVRLIAEKFDPGLLAAVEGGAETARQLLGEKFDYIFYTGSSRVGRLVMAAAAENLTPVTLELGGKNPCLLDRGFDLKTAARRIAWGKFFNAGQTCVAPDYLLLPRELESRFLEELEAAIGSFYGDDPRSSPDYGRIINEKHLNRLAGLIEGAEIAFGGEIDRGQKYLAPTAVRKVPDGHSLLEEEVFGPILPVRPYDTLDEALEFINRLPCPLALYFFSTDRKKRKKVIAESISGGVAVNDTISQILPPSLPFGGVGESGMGSYHGRASFETFSRHRSVLTRSPRFELPFRYPPYRTPLKTLKNIINLIK